MPVHATLELLETYVRVPCQGSLIDFYIFLPAKMSYLGILKHKAGYKCD